MAIIAVLYVVLVWLIFYSAEMAAVGVVHRNSDYSGRPACLWVFVGFLNSLAPAGRVIVVGKVVEVTPNVSGQIIDIPVQPNRMVKAGTSF